MFGRDTSVQIRIFYSIITDAGRAVGVAASACLMCGLLSFVRRGVASHVIRGPHLYATLYALHGEQTDLISVHTDRTATSDNQTPIKVPN